jgi:hypothetical protein
MLSRTLSFPVGRRFAARAGAVAALAAAAALAACNASDQLLSATDPDLVNPSDLANSEGAEALRLGAMERWKLTTGGDNTNGNDNTWLFGGLLADEWATSSTFVQNDEADERKIKLDNSTVTFAFRKLERVRTAVNQAIPAMQQFRKTDAQLNQKVAELYLAKAFAEMQLASDFCNGIPLSNAATADGTIELGEPLPVAQVFDSAAADAGAGLALLGSASDAESQRVGNALRITQARALLGNGKFAEAAALVAAVPTNYAYQHTFVQASGSNAIWGQPNSGRRYNVGDSLEGNARQYLVRNNVPFFSAKDPRVPASFTISANGRDTTKSQDGNTLSRTTPLWGQETPVDVANGIDARLIEAEAKLRAGDAAGMLSILNALRAAPQKLGTITTPQMPALTDPGTADGRLTLLFREKAFWTFGRGQRLGDLRRLIRQYSRTPENTFPVGEHYRGGQYGSDVNLPVPQDETNNPKFKGCLDRKA